MKQIKIFVLSLLLIGIYSLTSITVYAQDSTNPTINLTVMLKEDKINSDIKKYITTSGGQVISEIPEIGAIDIKCEASLIPQILSDDNVASVSPNLKIKLPSEKIMKFNDLEKFNTEKSDLYNTYQWDIKKVTKNGNSFKLQSGNHNVVVGIIDTGVNQNHPDLKLNFMGGKNFIPKGYENDLSETGDPYDINDRVGHGTHIAGTIAGNGRIMGVAPNIGFKSYRIFNSEKTTTASIVASAIIEATKDKVNVINLSIGGYNLKGKILWKDPVTGKIYDLGDTITEYEMYKRAIEYATKHGVTIVCSAGNDSLDCSNKNKVTEYLNNEYGHQGFKYIGDGFEVPGTIKDVITVSATGPNDKIASYSNYGSKFINIAAPGGEITAPSWNPNDMCLSTYQNKYAYMQGTSMAAPKVAAVAALIICENEKIKPKEIAKILYTTTQNKKEKDKYTGNGIVDATKALLTKK